MTQSDPTWLDDAFKTGGALTFKNGGVAVPGTFPVVNLEGALSGTDNGDGSITVHFDDSKLIDQATDLVDRDALAAWGIGQNGNQFLGFRGLTAPRTATLVSTPVAGTRVTVKDTDGGAAVHSITVDGNGLTIDGAATYVIGTAWGSVTLECNGLGTWSIVASKP